MLRKTIRKTKREDQWKRDDGMGMRKRSDEECEKKKKKVKRKLRRRTGGNGRLCRRRK